MVWFVSDTSLVAISEMSLRGVACERDIAVRERDIAVRELRERDIAARELLSRVRYVIDGSYLC